MFMETLQLFLGIVLVDIILGGDNAVIIALASRNLPREERKKAIFWGTFGAILLRIVLVLFATMMLKIPLLSAFGAVALMIIAVRIDKQTQHDCPAAKRLRDAIKVIIAADFVMSLDNVLALAGLAQGHLGLLAFGLALSLPLVVYGSQLLVTLMDRFAWIVDIGVAAIGWAAARMLLHDVTIGRYVQPYATVLILSLMAALVMVRRILLKRRTRGV